MLWKMRKDDELMETIMPMVEYDRPEAKVRLGRMYAYGRGVGKDVEKGKALMAEAAKKNPYTRPTTTCSSRRRRKSPRKPAPDSSPRIQIVKYTT